MPKKDKIEGKLVISRRLVRDWGGSTGVTLSPLWLAFQKWLGKEITELTMLADDSILMVRPELEEEAKAFYRAWEKAKENGISQKEFLGIIEKHLKEKAKKEKKE